MYVCYVMLCYVMLCYVMLCYVMLCMYGCMYVCMYVCLFVCLFVRARMFISTYGFVCLFVRVVSNTHSANSHNQSQLVSLGESMVQAYLPAVMHHLQLKFLLVPKLWTGKIASFCGPHPLLQ